MGIAISLVWLCVLQRMKVDSDLRWFQLRNVERLLSREKGIFSGGHEFFKNKTIPDNIGKRKKEMNKWSKNKKNNFEKLNAEFFNKKEDN